MNRLLALAALAILIPIAGCTRAPAEAPEGRFTDVAPQSGIAYTIGRTLARLDNAELFGGMGTLSSGVAVGDYDNDGNLDLYVIDSGPNALFRNLGNGHFQDTTAAMNASGAGHGRAALFLDYDNDGWQDLFLVYFTEPNRLLRNENGTRFQDVTRQAGLGQISTGHGASAADVDLDGDLDIFQPNYGRVGVDQRDYWAMSDIGQPNYLFVNNGDGTFTQEAQKRGLVDTRWTFQGSFADYDQDGDDDLYVCNDFGFDILYRNDGAGRFLEVTEAAGTLTAAGCMGVVWADYDGDLDLDAYVSNIYVPGSPVPVFKGQNLWLNQGGGRFLDEAGRRGVADALWAWGQAAFDAENDGDLDLYVTNGMMTMGEYDETYDAEIFLMATPSFDASPLKADPATWWLPYNATHTMVRLHDPAKAARMPHSDGGHQPNRFFLNDGSGHFQEAADSWGVGLVEDARAVADFDYDRDGDQDLVVVAHDRPVHLLRNEASQGHWIGLRLEGVESNRDGVGAMVKVITGDRAQLQERVSGTGFQTGNSPELHFGLGDADRVDRVEVRWPSGRTQMVTDLAADHVYRVVEGQATATRQ